MSILVDPQLDPASDPELGAAALQSHLYRGDLVVLTRLEAVRCLVEHVRRALAELFAPWDPEVVHRRIDPGRMAAILAEWKPAFIHSAEARILVGEVVRQAGLPAGSTYFDLPKPRTSFPVGHLTSGIAYAFPWHRDTWYGAPLQQVNWWLPVFPIQEDNAMGFDLAHFARAVENTSADFDYYRNNRDRRRTAAQPDGDRQARPAAVAHRPLGEVVLLPSPGAVLLFSGAHLHRSVPNTSARSRYSVDFRTVDAGDVARGTGAPGVDVHCTGTAIRDFVRVADGQRFDEATVRRWFGAPPEGAMLVYR